MTLAFSASIGLLLLIASSALIGYITNDIEGDADRELNQISFTIHRELTTEHEVNVEKILARERRLFGERLGVTIVDSSGKVVQSSARFAPPWPHTASDGWRVVTTSADGKTALVGMDWTLPAAALRKQKLSIVVFSLIIMLAASSGAWALVGNTLSPIGRLSYQAHAASGATLQVHLEAPSNDAEIVELVQTLNGMLARLSDATAQRGRFYAAASHELRTPLQALSGHLELAASRPRTAEEYRDAVAEAHSQTTRLVNLTRDLLLLNQLDGAVAPPLEELQLASVCDRTLRQFSGVIVARNLKLNWSDTQELTINAAPTHVEMVVRNLAENAVKYAEQGGEVDVRIDPDGPAIEIFNSCLPVPGWVPERTFEPLYRPDASRNSATGGNGLGLTICKAVCDLNHWPLQVSQVEYGRE